MGRCDPIERTGVVQQEYTDEEGNVQSYEQTQVLEVEEFVYYDPIQKIKFSFHPVTLEGRIEEEAFDWQAQSCSPDLVQIRYIK